MKTLKTIIAYLFISTIFSFGILAQENKPDEKVLAKNTETEKKEDKETKKEENKIKKEYSEAIADNSFYIEEAYNQEPGVMQTITNCAWFRRPSSDVDCTITQEFPFKSQKHQLSYTAPVSFLNSNSVRGFGDVMLNYRYQLTGNDAWATVAPRVSVILPSGNYNKGMSDGSAGLQLNLPVSKRVSEHFVTHFNAGMTYLPKAKGEDSRGNSIKRSLTSYNIGGSGIWLVNKKFNAMFEYVENFSSEIDQNGRVRRFNEHIVSPGFRYAIDIGGLQIVPGVAVPTSFNQGERRTGFFFYLSLEHPFTKQK